MVPQCRSNSLWLASAGRVCCYTWNIHIAQEIQVSGRTSERIGTAARPLERYPESTITCDFVGLLHCRLLRSLLAGLHMAEELHMAGQSINHVRSKYTSIYLCKTPY